MAETVVSANEAFIAGSEQRRRVRAPANLRLSFWLLVALLAWAPFPLGSARPWSWTLLTLIVVVAWAAWCAAPGVTPAEAGRLLKRVGGPLLLALLALLWGLTQMSAAVPDAWTNPVWAMLSESLGERVPGAISVNPWRTGTAVMLFGSYVMVAWLIYAQTQTSVAAARLLDALILIGTLYSVYALALGLSGHFQFELFYSGPALGRRVAGPFVLHNSFATYAGLTSLCAAVRLFGLGGGRVVTHRGARPFALSLLHFVFGRGLLPALAFALSVSMLIASGSRAGVMAALVGLSLLLICGAVVASRQQASKWGLAGAAVMLLAVLGLFLLNGYSLRTRLDELIAAGGTDPVRTALWGAAWRMIEDAPWSGLGLGTFENAYPLYADRAIPYVMDRAHNDYLELAAGWGVPAATAWIASILWLNLYCARALVSRRRARIFPALALGATALVGFHSLFDFSLQIPAVAVAYAAILGLGVAQSFPAADSEPADSQTRRSAAED
jgi:O-antigen ligase